jgi:hypothetical protein
MKNNLILELQQVGKVTLDTPKFVKKKYCVFNLAYLLLVNKHSKILTNAIIIETWKTTTPINS